MTKPVTSAELDQRSKLHEVFALPQGRALDICLKLQKAILEHRLSPGLKLSEDEVGEIYGASRTVVRASLQALAHSGLVSMEKNRGAFVAKPSIREAHEVFQARALIEPAVARLAAAVITDRQLAQLHAHLDAEHAALHASDMGKALFLSGNFHTEIADIADHRIFAGMIRSLISRSSLIIALYWKRSDTACESHSHHALMNAFEKRDSAAAESIQKSHIIDLHSGLDLKEKPAGGTSLSEALQG
ncbi:transcriptional regulator, GntR family protein [Stappia aggregata IAM 12614]|uniref:Transcriptional regulator, GntR family protein n=1 Tax=Roseibium aggregatum (strain ATCC 25650 / DSM 13394 / JCM 20685 / NBRC 16684 / NCIMB 2208 / IAM 12614 / B1) TaxID=384765 RepID=A0NTI7_ROSAI|nr:GntR family transcriptional regulator [Roseibium aggregatum]EAV43746.1 transcriptional regulator, GntR family protein [Stappia aggregata IAM 12614] [Roseibium aggregatum IAM 12614]